MLEYQVLLLRALPASQSAQPSFTAPQLAIFDPASGARLGTIHHGSGTGFWSRWLASSAWDVFETDDRSHVFSLCRNWAWSSEWAVHDSEGHCVGTVLTPPPRWADFRFFLSDVRRECFDRVVETRIEDARGRSIARLQNRGDERSFFSMAGAELGCLSGKREECTLTFAESLVGEPFTRMLLLAAALLQR